MAKVIACIASGSSLTLEDCQKIESLGIETIAVNSSWKMARFANHIYGGDSTWWQSNISEIDIPAKRWTCLENAAMHYKLELHHGFRGVENSGLRAIQLAIDFGATKIILLGYDCSIKNGTHWHGDHKNTANPTQATCDKWKSQFQMLNKKQSEIINCSRYTELECFKKMSLEDALCEL